MIRLLTTKLPRKAVQALTFLKTGGPGGLLEYLQFLSRNLNERRKYQTWIKKGGLSSSEKASRHLAELTGRTRISVLVPVFNTDERWLRRCLDSVVGQSYPHWELCIADDASTAAHVRRVLDEYSSRDSRIKVAYRETNGHISAASNSALELATGEFTVLLDHDDELASDALSSIARELDAHRETAMIYSDEDLIDESGRRSDPKFKPAFSRDLLYSTNLITHLSGYRTDLLREIGGFRVGFEGSQDYDLALRVIERIDEFRIRHIPRVLYHWRTIKGSVAYSMDEKPYAHERARQAIGEHLERGGYAAKVFEAPHHLHRVSYRAARPSVSIILTTDKNLDSLYGLVDDESEVIRVERTLEQARRLNEAARKATGEVLVFLDAGLSVRTADGFTELAAFALQKRIGAVGAKILTPRYFVEQSGLVLRSDLSVASAHQGIPYDAPGNLSRNLLTGNSSAVSSACMAISREEFETIGGFDPEIGALFDVDLCLRLRESGKSIVVVPHVVLIRRAGGTRVKVIRRATDAFQARWAKYVDHDPFCNPNLKRDGTFRLDL